MPIPWLTALKVIPWGDVIEHAPKVLTAARKLMDRQGKADAPSPESPASTSAPEIPLSELGRQLLDARREMARWQEDQTQLTRTVAELAEQNARLVTAVDALRVRTRLLLWAVVALSAGLAWALWR